MLSVTINSNENKIKCSRRKLHRSFDENAGKEVNSQVDNSASNFSESLNDTRRMLRSGTERISKSFNNLRTTFGSFSQRFRSLTKQRTLLEECPATPINGLTPQTPVHQVLGRTPTKLYSPFGIETPVVKDSNTGKENLTRSEKKNIKGKIKKGKKLKNARVYISKINFGNLRRSECSADKIPVAVAEGGITPFKINS